MFGCEGDFLLGILHHPLEHARPPVAATGVVLIVGGPQYRVGSHRQFVQLARGFADAGYATLRFDYRGMGDSTGAPRDFEAVAQDIRAALDALQAARPQIQQFVLWGLCDGASAILLYLDGRTDSRVAAIVLANPWVRSPQSLAQTHMKHYDLQRLTQKDFWARFARGKVGLRALKGVIRSATEALGRSRPRTTGHDGGPLRRHKRPGSTFQDRMAEGLRAFGGKTLLLLSEDDYTAKEFVEFASRSVEWKPLLRFESTTRVSLPNTDHTFSGNGQGPRALACCVEWMNLVFCSPCDDRERKPAEASCKLPS